MQWSKPAEPWTLVPESGPERFLTVSGQRAVELTIAQGSDGKLEQLADSFEFEADAVRVYKPNSTDTIVYYLNLPLATFLLIVVGLVALYVELSAPGISVGGLIAGLCACLFFWSRFLGGTSGWLEVILFVAGLTFIAMEIFVIPGFGVSGLSGIILLFASVLLAGQNFVVPQTAQQWNQTLTSTLTLMGSSIIFIVSAFFITRHFGSLPFLNKFVLAPPSREAPEDNQFDKDGKLQAMPHPEVSVGDWGVADSLLRPAGRAKFGGRSFDVISDGTFVERGTQVRVVSIKGNVITVAEIAESEPSTEK